MSWYGDHATISKAEVKQVLPPGACKRCVYWFRIVMSRGTGLWYFSDICTRCGIDMHAEFARLTGVKVSEETNT